MCLFISVFVMGILENKLIVYVFDVGGGFGFKIYYYGEEVLVLVVVKKLGCLVKWMFIWIEVFLSDVYGWDYVIKIELVCEKDGIFIVFRIEMMVNVGVYLLNFFIVMLMFLYGILMVGNYMVLYVYVNVKVVFINMVLVDVYCGVGCLEVIFSFECVIDKVVCELGIDFVVIWWKNFVKFD